MGPDNSGQVKSRCAESTKVPAHGRDFRKKDYCPAAEARRSARHWNSSGDCRCSLAQKSPMECHCCCAYRRCLPTADDRSSRAHGVKCCPDSNRPELGDHPSREANSGPGHSPDDLTQTLAADDRSSCVASFALAPDDWNRRSLAERVRGRWRCPALPRCAHCRRVRGCCSLRSHSPSGCHSAWPKEAGSARVRVALRSFPNLLRSLSGHCRGGFRTDRLFSYSRAHPRCQPGRSLLLRRPCRR